LTDNFAIKHWDETKTLKNNYSECATLQRFTSFRCLRY
jgi:hypothetical protein